jgi:hypothetical protein
MADKVDGGRNKRCSSVCSSSRDEFERSKPSYVSVEDYRSPKKACLLACKTTQQIEVTRRTGAGVECTHHPSRRKRKVRVVVASRAWILDRFSQFNLPGLLT